MGVLVPSNHLEVVRLCIQGNRKLSLNEIADKTKLPLAIVWADKMRLRQELRAGVAQKKTGEPAVAEAVAQPVVEKPKTEAPNVGTPAWVGAEGVKTFLPLYVPSAPKVAPAVESFDRGLALVKLLNKTKSPKLLRYRSLAGKLGCSAKTVHKYMIELQQAYGVGDQVALVAVLRRDIGRTVNVLFLRSLKEARVGKRGHRYRLTPDALADTLLERKTQGKRVGVKPLAQSLGCSVTAVVSAIKVLKRRTKVSTIDKLLEVI